MLLPPHENIFLLGNIVNRNRPPACLLLERPEGVKLGPVVEINLMIGAPVLMFGKEAIFGADDLALEVCREGWMVLS